IAQVTERMPVPAAAQPADLLVRPHLAAARQQDAAPLLCQAAVRWPPGSSDVPRVVPHGAGIALDLGAADGGPSSPVLR
ncbi:MAG: hypothetical protein ACTHNK_12470, partial [Thermomicrobiales bacterium]